jgi:predicted phage terminase large subunit-like protein
MSGILQPEHHEAGRQLLYGAADTSFAEFQRLMHPVVSGEPYIHAVHLQAIAYALERVAKGECRRLLIAVPPRHFKSYLASVALPAYLLGKNPATRIVCASYGMDLARTFAVQTRDIMSSPAYRDIFPETALLTSKPSATRLQTTRSGYRFATSTQGILTGIGADVAIIDDPMKASDAASDVVRDAVGDWFKSSLMSRFDKPMTSRTIVVMQRLHQDDLLGRLQAEGGWETLELPGEAPTGLTLSLAQNKAVTLSAGAILFPERFSKETLAELRADLGESAYAAQVLQRPTPAGGHLFNLGNAPRYHWHPKITPEQFEAVIVSVDCAAAIGASADYTAITTWGVMGKKLYLLDAVRGRWPLGEMLSLTGASLDKHQACKCVAAIIEKGGSGIALAHELKLQNRERIYYWSPQQAKPVRGEFTRLMMEKKRVWLPKDAPWLGMVEQELAAFPHGKTDDFVDSITQVPWNLENFLGHTLGLSSWPQSKCA